VSTNNIFLIGFMGTGKSAVARYLGRTYGFKVMDCDQEIVALVGKSIPEMFEQDGEAYFRQQESLFLKQLSLEQDTVISCGGGMALNPDNVYEMKKHGRVVLLTSTPQTIFERLQGNANRPLLKDKLSVAYITEMMEKRSIAYESAADVTILSDSRSVAEIGEEVYQKSLKRGN